MERARRYPIESGKFNSARTTSQQTKNSLEQAIFISMVLEVGLEPTEAEAGRFTVSCDCHYAIPAIFYILTQKAKKHQSTTLLFSKPDSSLSIDIAC